MKVGDEVEKIGGDSYFRGRIVGVITKRSGAERIVVEDDRGLLMTYNESQLCPVPASPPATPAAPDLTEEEIAELERMERGATRGPWEFKTRDEDEDLSDNEGPADESFEIRMDSAIASRGHHDVNHCIEADWMLTPGTTQHAEAVATLEFIAAARNALPRLLSEVRKGRAERPKQQEAARILAAFIEDCHADTDAPWQAGATPKKGASDGR